MKDCKENASCTFPLDPVWFEFCALVVTNDFKTLLDFELLNIESQVQPMMYTW